MMNKYALCGYLLLGSIMTVMAQADLERAAVILQQSNQYLKKDLKELVVTDSYQTAHNGVQHLYLQQHFQSIPITSARANFNFTSEDELINYHHRLVRELDQKINPAQAIMPAHQALDRFLQHYQISAASPVLIKQEQDPQRTHVFSKEGLALEDVKVSLVYQPTADGMLRLSWEIYFYELSAENLWVSQIDTETGELLADHNLVTHCEFPAESHNHHQHAQPQASIFHIGQNASTVNNSYNVYATPVESPNHGVRSVEVSPWAQAGLAGSLGWHNDGTTTYTHSKGNNVDAYEDNNNTNGPTGGNDARVDGGANLEFDFPLDLTVSPLEQQDPIITNLFYWNNIIHDIWYQYGFDEVSGNFQEDNQGRGGSGGDSVNAEAQDDVNSARNNANFATPTDGGNPRMQMYLWTVVGSDSLEVTAPAGAVGDYLMVPASFGGSLGVAVTGEVIEADDGTGGGSDACDALINGGAITGKIALIDRGGCNFTVKVENAQDAGAIAVIVCQNTNAAPFGMGGTNANITIPSVMIGQDDCTTIRGFIGSGLTVTMEAKGRFFIANGTPAEEFDFAQASFGADLPTLLTADIEEVDDGNGTTTDACSPLINDLTGKIALLDRGGCEFGLKCLNAQNAGAAAVIVCNNVDGDPFNMGPGDDGDQVTIPAIMISQGDCVSLRAMLPVTGTLKNNGAPELDSDLDNGVITHEYGHGISIRLTGGPSNSSCLNNAEQMGEGWSDFFGLWVTTQTTDTHDQPRGMGTYLLSEPTDGDGIRPSPYSTDFAVNNSTYGDIQSSGISQPHGIGYLWCTMLWDLNWAMINANGYEADLYNSSSSAGNVVTMQLVMDGLKLQPCGPGFVDGRDAILQADVNNNSGANRDIIWNVFARRGLGFSADQGAATNRNDGSEAFDLPPDVPALTYEELFELAPLPVELVAFRAVANDEQQQIELSWQTASEQQNRGFYIERATNLVGGFSSIGWVDGQGTRPFATNYELVDREVQRGVLYYYRLKQVDEDGSFTYSEIVTGELLGTVQGIALQPNPAKATTSLLLPPTYQGAVHLALYQADGRRVAEQIYLAEGDTVIDLDVSTLPEGVYFLQVQMDGQEVQTRQLVVRH